MSGQSQLPDVFFCILGLNLDPFGCSMANNFRCLLSTERKISEIYLQFTALAGKKKDLEHTVWQRFGGDKFKFFVGVVSK